MLREFPYSNFHELNLDWLLNEVKEGDAKIATLDESVGSLNERVTGVEQNIDPLITSKVNSTLNQWRTDGTLRELIDNRDFLFIGDSYGDNPRVPSSWGKECATALGLASSQWHNLCRSGASWNSVNGHSYQNQLEGYTGNRAAVTDIILLAGANDATTSRANILSRAIEMMAYIRTNYPNATVYVGYIALGLNYQSLEGAEIAYHAYNSLGAYGYAVFKNAIASNHRYETLEDGQLHPDLSAVNTIAWSLASALIGGDFYFDLSDYDNQNMLDVSTQGYTIGRGGFYTRLDDSFLNIHSDMFMVHSAMSMENDTWYEIGTLVRHFLKGGSRIHDIPIICSVNVGTATNKTVMGMMKIENFHVSIKVFIGNTALTGITNLYIGVNTELPLINC